MTTNPTKRVICWGLWVSPQGAIEFDGKVQPRYMEMMGVTSFSQNFAGTRMAHGHSLNDGPKKSIHRKADGMFFYQTREAMETVATLIHLVDRKHHAKIQAAIELSAQVQREHRLHIERVAGAKSIQPAELED